MRPVPAGTPVARTLPLVARYTWALQWPSAALEGLAAGIIGLSAFIVKRSLGAPEWAVPVLIALWQLVWVFAPGIGPFLARAHPQRLWRVLAFATFLPLFGIAFVDVTPAEAEGHGHGHGNLTLFMVLMALHYGAAIASVPHRGALLRTNYPQHVRGRMFGLFLVANLLAAAVAAKSAGYLLDSDPRWVRVIYPAASASGIAAFLLMGRIRWRRSREARRLAAAASHGVAKAMTHAWRETFRILREDKAFGTYERGFMLYGLGFLSSVGLLVLYAEERLHLSYDGFTSAQSVAFPLAQIAGAALFGRLSDRRGVVRTTAVSFFLLCVFFGLMPLVGSAVGLAAACVLWGIAMGGVNVGWSLGPLHFAPDGQAHMYGAVHFCMVGIRSLIGPFLGFAMKKHFGFPAAFALSAVLVASGGVTVWRLGHVPSRAAVS
ncbi:MAG: MFS transporter [Planctomycetota bacterium]